MVFKKSYSACRAEKKAIGCIFLSKLQCLLHPTGWFVWYPDLAGEWELLVFLLSECWYEQLKSTPALYFKQTRRAFGPVAKQNLSSLINWICSLYQTSKRKDIYNCVTIRKCFLFFSSNVVFCGKVVHRYDYGPIMV